MSNRNEDRTLSGSTQIYADILDLPQTTNALRIKNTTGSAGQVIAKNTTTNKIEWAVVPIADNTIETDMIKNGAITGAKMNANVDGSFNIDTSGGIEAQNITADGDLVVTGNVNLNGNLTTIGNSNSDSLLTRGSVLFFDGANPVGALASNTATLTISNVIAPNSLSVGAQSELVVDGGAHTATFGASTIFGGEMSMATGGSEVFDMNDHNITDCGGIAFTTGSDITNCDTITANTLNLNTALSMSNINLDLGSGDLTCDNATFDGGAVLINGTGIVCKVSGGGVSTITMNHTNGIISCKGLGTSTGNITTSNGTIDAGNGKISTTGEVECGTIDATTLEGSTSISGALNAGLGTISSNNSGEIIGYGGLLDINLGDGTINSQAITCKAINTQNQNIEMGSGAITANTATIGNLGGGLCNLSTANCGLITVSNNTTGITGATALINAGQTFPIKVANLDNSFNDIARTIACKSFFADHSYTRSIGTSYKNIDKDSTTLNVSFAVPPSCMILVETGFYVSTDLSNERMMMRLINSAGAEFYGAYINDSDLGHSTESMEIQFATSYSGRGQLIIMRYFLKFPTAKANTIVNLQPQVKLNTGSCNITTGGSYTGQTPPMYVKVESLGSNSSFGWHYEES